MSEAVKIDPGTVTFETKAGVKFEVPVADFAKELTDIAAEMQATFDAAQAANDHGKMKECDRYAYIARVQGLVSERYDASLSFAETEWFAEEVHLQSAKKKQMRRADIEGRLSSAFSMGSTASNSTA